MNKRQAAPYLLLLVVFVAWLYLKPQQQLTALPEHHPSYIGYNITNNHFDETGVITHKVYATKATNYTNKGLTLFDNPKAIIYILNEQEGTTTTWQITGETGVLSEDNQLVLSGNVWVKNLSLDQLVQTMNTEKLTILLNEKEISSDLLVDWQGPQMKQQGIGMWASLVTEELIVKQQIKAVYLNETK